MGNDDFVRVPKEKWGDTRNLPENQPKGDARRLEEAMEAKERSRLQPAAASEADNVSTPQSTGLSAIAQERDVGKWRKKPVVVDAWQFVGFTDVPEWFGDVHDETNNIVASACGEKFYISTLEGIMTADPLDWIIRGVKGELYPCKPDIFAATYEPAFTTSPKAISEAPISADAVKSNDVAEMVERLRAKLVVCETKRAELHDERERLREALKPFADAWDVAMACHSPQMTMGRLGIVASHEVTGVHFRNARSALPHPDTKGT